MHVTTPNEKIDAHAGRASTELLLSDYPADAESGSKTRGDELLALAAEYGVEYPPAADGGDARTGQVAGIPSGNGRPIDRSSPVIRVDHQACILCDRCIRACDDVQVNAVIGRTGKGYATRIGFDLDVPMGVSTCVSCGECEKVCPTGALSLVQLVDELMTTAPKPRSELKQVDSVCPYCGVGCAITYHVDEEQNRRRVRRRPRQPREPRAPVREGALRLRLRASPAAPHRAAHPARFGISEGAAISRSRAVGLEEAQTPGRAGGLRARAARISAKRRGRRRSSWPAGGCARSRKSMVPRRWPASAAPSAVTRKPTCSRS